VAGRDKLQSVVVIIGMRGAGKSSLGRKAAENLQRHLLDLDEVLEKQVLGCSINDFVAKSGWSAFREAEAKLLEDVVLRRAYGADAAQGCVVACGGGVVETPSAQRLLMEVSPVVFVDRHIDDILKCLEGAGSYRPGLGVPPQEVYARRLPIYHRCCSHVFTLKRGDEDWAALNAEFASFLRHAEGAPSREARLGADTFVVPVPGAVFEDPDAAPALLRRAAAGADVLELRADLLPRPLDQQQLLEHLALLRRHCHAPVCFTLRSVDHGGQFDGSAQEAMDLAKLAIKAACALVDVEPVGLAPAAVVELAAARGATRLVASLGEGRHQLRPAAAEPLLRRLARAGVFDVVRLKLEVSTVEEALEARCMAHRVSQEHAEMEVSLTLSGEQSRLGSLLNRVLTPASSPALPGEEVPRVLPVSELAECRAKLSLLDPRRHFFIFGHPVALSASPTIQNTGFRVNGMPHVFGRYDAPSIEDVLWKLSLVSTGGGAVTIPHKEELLEHMHELSESAREIGAVNTVTKEAGSSKLRGDNTDWIGIRGQLAPKLQERPGGRVGLILGAGGTARAAAFAFKKLGFAEVHVLNRTVEKAAVLAKAFGDSFKVVRDPKELASLTRLDAVMGTLPGTAGFTLPDGLLADFKPVVIDAAYQSSASGERFTALLRQAKHHHCALVEGLEMLFEQGCAQCELWTGKPAPRKEIARALLADRFDGDASPPEGLLREAGIARAT